MSSKDLLYLVNTLTMEIDFDDEVVCPSNLSLLKIDIVMYRLIARQRCGKQFPAKAKARNSRTSNARQRMSKMVHLSEV